MPLEFVSSSAPVGGLADRSTIGTDVDCAGSGIGLETALTFVERGARGVVFADQNLEAVKKAAERSRSLATAEGYQALVIEVDVASRPAVRSMVAQTVSTFGRIDYAINCAGVRPAFLHHLCFGDARTDLGRSHVSRKPRWARSTMRSWSFCTMSTAAASCTVSGGD